MFEGKYGDIPRLGFVTHLSIKKGFSEGKNLMFTNLQQCKLN